MNNNPSHFHCICVTDLEHQLGALRREYDEEVISHDIEEHDLRAKLEASEKRCAELEGVVRRIHDRYADWKKSTRNLGYPPGEMGWAMWCDAKRALSQTSPKE